jgi:hypothetical protein
MDRAAQIKDRGDPAPVESLAHLIASCWSVAETKAAFEKLEVEANKLGWPLDRDFAAVALQHYSGAAQSREVRIRMLSVAAGRASWCASCATAGAEGISRSFHVKELEAQLQRERA